MTPEDAKTALPVRALPEDIVDIIAREVSLDLKEHIEAMYPAAAAAVAWNSCARSIQGTIRNTMKAAGVAAEEGRIEQWLSLHRRNRRELKALRRKNGLGYCGLAGRE